MNSAVYTSRREALDQMFAQHAAVRERARRKVVILVFIWFWMLVLEGAVRKWVLPGLGDVFYFVRAPVTLLIYVIALKHGFFPKRSDSLLLALILAFLGFVQGAAHYIFNYQSIDYLLVAVVGWYSYFFYIPLTFVMAEVFDRDFLRKLMWQITLLGLVATPLLYLQFQAPANSIINTGDIADQSRQFITFSAGSGRVRPSGLFSVSLGEVQFAAALFELVLATWMVSSLGLAASSTKLKFLATAVLIFHIAFSQSRTLILYIGATVASLGLMSVSLRGNRHLIRALATPVIIVVLTLTLWPILSPDTFTSFSERWTGAGEIEDEQYSGGVYGRAFSTVTEVFQVADEAPVWGYGIGFGANAASRIIDLSDVVGAENGLTRHIFELGPILGLLFVFFRFFLAAMLFRKAWKFYARTLELTPLVMWFFAGISLATAQITGQSTVNGFTWFFCGVLLGCCRLQEKMDARY